MSQIKAALEELKRQILALDTDTTHLWNAYLKLSDLIIKEKLP